MGFTSSGEWKHLTFTDDRYYHSTHYDDESSPTAYNRNDQIEVFATVTIQTRNWVGQCNAWSESGSIWYVLTFNGNSLTIPVIVFGGCSDFYFQVYTP